MFYLLDLAVVNAYIMYTTSTESSQKLTHEQFWIELAKELLLKASIDEERDLRPTGGCY